MTGLPPFGFPMGDEIADAEMVDMFVHDRPGWVHSPTFHVEGSVLVAGGDVAAAMRIGPRTFLLRLDLPPDVEPARQAVQRALLAAGMTCIDNETLLAAPIAIQVLGLRTSTWDLWGADLEESFAQLRTSAAGEWGGIDGMFPEGPPAMPGPGPDD